MIRLKNMKTETKLLTSIVVVLLVICTLLITSLSASALTTSTTRKALWQKGGVSSASNSDILTANALVHYAAEGVWGTACQTKVKTAQNNGTKILLVKDGSGTEAIGTLCPMAQQFYQDAEKYGTIVDARMKIADPTGKRTDDAMTRFSNLANEVFAIMVGFGCLTAILVFTIIFMKMAWMPSHAMQRRAVMIEIATSGASIMLLGNVWLVISLFQSCFNRFWQTFAVYSTDWRTVANMVLVEYKGFITGVSGIATLLVLAMFVVNFIGIALDGGVANKRAEKIGNILHCAIAAAGLGSITLIVGFFWNLFA